MDEDITNRPKPKHCKLVIVFDEERPCYAAYVDEKQFKKIMEILTEERRRMAQ